MLSDMDSEGDIYPVTLYSNKNTDEYYPTFTEAMAGYEEYQCIDTTNIEIRALEKRYTWVTVKRYHITTNYKIPPFT